MIKSRLAELRQEQTPADKESKPETPAQPEAPKDETPKNDVTEL
jgi:hypothetical protein